MRIYLESSASKDGKSPTVPSAVASCCSAGITLPCIAGRNRNCFAVFVSCFIEARRRPNPDLQDKTNFMCGICGQYNFDSQTPVVRQEIERMTRSITHRGPDDEGYYIAGPLGFGFRRLSIIDLAGGHQPMSDREESVWVVFNGEIYNFPELRSELEQYGHVFRTNSDTEVIVHGYKQWGDEVLNRLNGMFGLAIWDARQRRLVLARDPFGIKLLYYRIDGNSLYFGSEIPAIRPTITPGR